MDQGVALQHLPPNFNPFQQPANLRAFQQTQQRQHQRHHQQHPQHVVPTLPPSYANITPVAQHAYMQQRQLSSYQQPHLPVTGVNPGQATNPYLHPPIHTYVPIAHSLPPQNAVGQPQRQQQQILPATNAPVQRIPRQPQLQRSALAKDVAPVRQANDVQHVRPEPMTAADAGPSEQNQRADGLLEGMKMIPDPPDLQRWRERLFNIDELVVLSENEFQTYFPHVDNVYSHRSSQKYKRKPFVSHYWDCRLKGRPAGTPKSDDPNKKKRKRVARERNLCDVKIKITEYLPGATREEVAAHLGQQPGAQNPQWAAVEQMFSTAPNPWDAAAAAIIGGQQGRSPVGGSSKRFFTIQRVNGTGGSDKMDGNDGRHRHTLEESDKIKKNSVIRLLLKNDKVEKTKLKIQDTSKKTYHKKATGPALATVKKHSKEDPLKLFGGCFCPFVQRVWISLEHKGLAYQYIEVDPYKKPESLLAINPRGLIPALKHGDWGCYESTVLMEYLEDLGEGAELLPQDPKLRANSRLWSDHINRHIIPTFYRYLQEQDTQKQVEHESELTSEIAKLIDAADSTGPFFLGAQLSFVDVQIAPWVLRLRRVLKPYRGWPEPEPGSRWARWVHAIEENSAVQRTTSTDELYLDSYERYADNRPNTSQVANAVNSGRGLP